MDTKWNGQAPSTMRNTTIRRNHIKAEVMEFPPFFRVSEIIIAEKHLSVNG
jgi:hypothetical protein